MVCVNLVVLRKLCEESRCFPGKFTQLAQILHDRQLWRSRQISSLCVKAFLRKIIKICFEVGISEPLWNVFDVIKFHELTGFDILKTSPEKDCWVLKNLKEIETHVLKSLADKPLLVSEIRQSLEKCWMLPHA